MPLKLVPPRQGKSPNYTIRGHYLGQYVDKSTGTPKRSVAQTQLKNLEDAIERGHYPPKPEIKTGPTFIAAAVSYMQATGQRRHIAKLIKHFGETPISEMTQEAIDAAALEIAPLVVPATRSRCVYIPVSAIMHLALGDKCPPIRHTNGGKGKMKTEFMWPADAFAIIEEADKIDTEFGLYLRLLIYTGIRKSEGLGLLSADVQPGERAAWIRTSKNDDPRMLRLRLDLVGPLFQHLKSHTGERLFKFNDGGHFKHLLTRAKLAACGLPCPKRRPVGWKQPEHRLSFVGFHTFRHSWSTWMRRYGGLDLQGLVATGNWRDPKSAARYAHVVAREEWDRVDALPDATWKARGKTANE